MQNQRLVSSFLPRCTFMYTPLYHFPLCGCLMEENVHLLPLWRFNLSPIQLNPLQQQLIKHPRLLTMTDSHHQNEYLC